MKLVMQFGLGCLLASGVFAAHQGGAGVSGGHSGSVASGRSAVHAHGSMRTYGYGRYGGYGYGGYYEPFFDSGYYPPADTGGSNVTVVYPPQAPQSMVTQTAHSVIHEYAQPEDYAAQPEAQSHPILYLIAFRDNTIRAAMTYWVEDGAVHYLDKDHQARQAPLSSIDRDLSAQLNRERHVPFSVP
jgi:hypothetical protein